MFPKGKTSLDGFSESSACGETPGVIKVIKFHILVLV